MRFAVLLLLCAASFAQTVPNPTAPTGSGCVASGNPSYCNKSFPVQSTDPANTNAQTQVTVPAPLNYSTADIHTLLYSGATTRVLMHYQPWFCNTGTTCNSHINIGYNENSTATVTAQLSAMKALGVDVVVPDYYGNSASKAFNLATVDAMAGVIAGSPSSYPKMLLGMDQGAWSNAGQCPAGSGITTAQMEACIDAQLDFAAGKYFFQSWYETSGGKLIVTFFLDETGWPSVDWDATWQHEHAHVAAGQSCGTGCTYTSQVLLIGRNSASITRSGFDGGFAWPPTLAYNNASPSTQFQYDGSAGYFENFYSICRANPAKLCIGAIYKGFDDSVASFGTDKITAQQCGQVLLLTAGKISGAGYSSSSQLAMMQVATWNDMEETTGVENGVDNCAAMTSSLSNGFLNWTISPTDVTYFSSSTIDHLRLVACLTTCSVITDNIPFGTSGSSSIRGLTVGTTVYMQAVGKSMIRNLSSPGIAVPPPTAPAASLYAVAH